MDVNNSWWVSELQVADCKKGWPHPEWKDAMQKWYSWLQEMKKKDEEKREHNVNTKSFSIG